MFFIFFKDYFSCVTIQLMLHCYMSLGVGAKMKLLPESLTVVRGDEASFTCSPSNSAWTVMVWLLNGRAVLTISKETGVLPSIHPNVTAVLNKDGWRFVMKSTERDNEGQVTCDLQLIDRRTANLFVQGLCTFMWVCVCVVKMICVLTRC